MSSDPALSRRRRVLFHALAARRLRNGGGVLLDEAALAIDQLERRVLEYLATPPGEERSGFVGHIQTCHVLASRLLLSEGIGLIWFTAGSTSARTESRRPQDRHRRYRRWTPPRSANVQLGNAASFLRVPGRPADRGRGI